VFAFALVLTVDNGVGVSGRSRRSIFLIANRVAEGGVFSPRMDLGGGRLLFLRLGVSLSRSRLAGVGVASLEVDGAGEPNLSVDLPVLLVAGVLGCLSGDLSGVLSSIARMSLTVLFCSDCRRLWAAPLINDRSGERSGIGFMV
jgi:hypothetical protein